MPSVAGAAEDSSFWQPFSPVQSLNLEYDQPLLKPQSDPGFLATKTTEEFAQAGNRTSPMFRRAAIAVSLRNEL